MSAQISAEPKVVVDSALQLVGVVSESTLASAGRLQAAPGYEPGQQVRFVKAGPLAAVVVQTSVGFLAGPDAERRLRDLDWVQPRVARHDQILAELQACGPVLPVGFGSVFSGEARLAAWVGGREAVILAFLDEVAGAAEWSVRVFGDRSAAVREALRARVEAAGSGGASPGAAYMLEKRLKPQAERDATALLAEHTDALLDAVEPACVALVDRAVGTPAEEGLECVAHAAALVRSSDRAAFDAALDAAAEAAEPHGLSVELSGPWPAYSFVPEALTKPC